MCIDAHHPVPCCDRRTHSKEYQKDGRENNVFLPVGSGCFNVFRHHVFAYHDKEPIPYAEEQYHSENEKNGKCSTRQWPEKERGFRVYNLVELTAFVVV
jgi:hypothetical protein